jgi:hypothetical protein
VSKKCHHFSSYFIVLGSGSQGGATSLQIRASRRPQQLSDQSQTDDKDTVLPVEPASQVLPKRTYSQRAY